MFCKNCSATLNDDVAFCTNCGTPVNDSVSPITSPEVVEDDIVKLEVQPTFILGYQILHLIKNIFITFFCILLCFEESIEFLFEESGFFVGILILATIGNIIAMLFKKVQYTAINYKFYNTKVEYIDGFLNKEQKDVKYKFIREVTMTQNIFERMFGIGTIKLFTNASSVRSSSNNHSQTGKNGILIHCVEEPKKVLESIKELLDAVDTDSDY